MTGELVVVLLGTLVVVSLAAPFVWLGLVPPSGPQQRRQSPPRPTGRRW